jgi:hypothetical protein
MSDVVSTWCRLPRALLNPATAPLVACEDCAFIWVGGEHAVEVMDTAVMDCPHCKGTNCAPLYALEDGVEDWERDRNTDPHGRRRKGSGIPVKSTGPVTRLKRAGGVGSKPRARGNAKVRKP